MCINAVRFVQYLCQAILIKPSQGFVRLGLMASLQMQSCSICNTFRTITFKKLLHHIRFSHSIEPNFSIRCGIDGCERKYRVFSTFYSHLRKFHKRVFDVNIRHDSNSGGHEDTEVGTSLVTENIGLEVDDVTHNSHKNSLAESTGISAIDAAALGDGSHIREIGERSTERDFALFILGMKEKHKLPLTVTNSIILELSELIYNSSRDDSTEIKEKLSASGFTVAKNPDIFNFIDEKFEKKNNIFEKLASDYKQTAFYKEHFGLVEPVEHVLGSTCGKDDTFIYVPLLDTLKSLLSHDDILAEVLKSRSRHGDKRYEDYCDGEAFQNHPLFSLEPHALQVHFYYDDFGVVNPLRNKANSYKVAAFYFVLGNLSPKFRSKLSSIQLVCLCCTRLIKQYGFGKVLKPLLEDVKVLESKGVTITTLNQEEFTFKGCISLVSMDNLAAHQLGGFQQHFHAGRICRFCMASSNDIQDHFDSSSLIERTSVGHKHQVQLVMENQGLRHVYGVASKSVLSDLQYFDVISCLPPDPAHDLLEGLVPELMTKVVTTFIQDGFFTLESFNSALKLFPFGKSDQKSKPTCNTTANLGSFKIKQTASQTWCLMRLLPLIIGSSIPEGNEYWELFLSLMDICEITFAPSIPCEMVAYLEYLVHGFLVALKELFPEDRIKPKSHYLLHYPRSILKYGPLVHCWTMRFEAKHAYFKEIANRQKNRRNLCKTLARRHQLLMCYYGAGQNFLDDKMTSNSGGDIQKLHQFCDGIQRALKSQFPSIEEVHTLAFVELHSSLYAKGCCMVLEARENRLHEFGKIDAIFIKGGKVYFVLMVLHTIGYSQHFHSYVLCFQQKWVIFAYEDFACHLPLSIYTNQNQRMVTLKYFV